ncbi:MAG: DUF255 domain-containing protein [Microbacteriaceae bacterium]
MANRLAHAVSPYLRAHADNPVDWWPWGEEAFAEAERRDVPVLVSIGYSTCHWCHVMARESFSDPEIAELLADGFVAVKVDREEHPDVDATYLAAASAFTQNLGWPLTVFTTPRGRAFFAGTYFPPQPAGGIPAFRQVLGAIREAWSERRDAVEESAGVVAEALARQPAPSGDALPDSGRLAAVVRALVEHEDTEQGGFGQGPKFPVAPVLDFLLQRADDPSESGAEALGLVTRTLGVMASRGLRDGVEGGFFRYTVQRDWTEPHYERMLTDNAQLLDAYGRLAVLGARADAGVAGLADDVADGIARFLVEVMRLDSGAFAAAQNSESLVDGVTSEGGYYALDADARRAQPRPDLDTKVIAGWNGMAIGALAEFAQRRGRDDLLAVATAAADAVLAAHYRAAEDGAGDDGQRGRPRLIRASDGGRLSEAVATLEDHGLLAAGLLRLSLATGRPDYAVVARDLVEACLTEDGGVAAPGGADPVLAARGLAMGVDLSEGAAPSGLSALADAALRLHAVTGDPRHRAAAESAVALLATPALEQPISFGAALSVLQRLATPVAQLVVVTPDAAGADEATAHETGRLSRAAGSWSRIGGTLAVVTESAAREFADAGFELFAARTPREGQATAYLCEHFVCALPVTDPDALERALRP